MQNISKSYERISVKFFGEVEHGPETNRLDFGSNPVSFLDPGSFSRILYHWQMGHKLTFCSVSRQAVNRS